MRSQARETVFKFIFSRLFNPSDEGLFDVLNKDLNEKDKNFAIQLLGYIDANLDKYTEKTETLAKNCRSGRIYGTDKCAIFIGMAELENFVDNDVPVIIDEAVKLAAKYSTEKSTDFVNGILAEYAKEVRG